MKTNYSIKTMGDKDILCKNDKPCICPFRNPIHVPTKTLQGNGLTMMDIPCSTDCPLLLVDDKMVILGCATDITLEIE
jgi:hypothetical protein